jgi:hypothetical protein
MSTKVLPANDFQPQFYDHETELAKVNDQVYAETDRLPVRRERKLHVYKPEAYLQLWDRRFRVEEESMRKMWEMATTMHRRYRGVTVSDQYGYFGTMPQTQGVWIDYDPEQDGEVHPINIVRPDIRANTAAMLQAQIGVEVEASSQNAQNQLNANRIQMLLDFFERDTWKESDRILIYDAAQKEGTVLVESFLDFQNGCDQKVVKPQLKESSYAGMMCPTCNSTSVQKLEPEQVDQFSQLSQLPCPHCQQPAEFAIKKIRNVELAEDSKRTGEISHRTWSLYNVVIDRHGARRSGLQSATYLKVMELVDRAELEDRYPQFEFTAPFDWSYGLKCQYALANADWSLLYNGMNPLAESNEWDKFQTDRIFLHEQAYRNYVSPEDWEFRGFDGKCKFRIKRGQSWKDAVTQSFGEGVRGFRFVFCNERLVDIEGPPEFEPNFRKCFTDVHFNRDAGSYHSIPLWDSKQIQDDITLFNTLKTEVTARNAIRPVVFNSDIFDLENFGQEYVPTKDGALDPEQGDIQKAAFQLPTASVTDDVAAHLEFLLGIRREVSGVQPALLGESQPDQPYAAQRQQLEQAFGLLTSCGKSFASMKVDSMKQKLIIAFEHYTLEQFQAIAARFGEEWNEADVDSLTSIDLERDVRIDYIPGSEIPQGNLSKELKFFNALREVMPFIQSQMVPPEVIVQILKRIDEFADFDFDLSGSEVSDSLAQKRYQLLCQVCKEYKGLEQQDIEAYGQKVVSQEIVPVNDPETGQPIGETIQPITALQLLLEEILEKADVYISPVENPAAQIMFFTTEVMRELSKPKPNYLLVEVMQALLTKFQQMAQEAMAQQVANSPEGIASKNEAEGADKQNKAKAEGDEKSHERNKEMKLLDEASKENDREFGREKMANDIVTAKESAKAKTPPKK